MSSLTTNLKLVKPELQDNITPTIFADNFDKIDAALEGVSGGALSLEEIEASTNLDGKIPSAAALKEVNNSIGNTGKCDLLLTQAPTSTKSVQLPHSLNDYRSIIVINRAPSGNLTCTSVCPIDILKTTNASAVLFVDSANTNNRTSVYYIDDTHLGVYALGVTCMVYGVK